SKEKSNTCRSLSVYIRLSASGAQRKTRSSTRAPRDPPRFPSLVLEGGMAVGFCGARPRPALASSGKEVEDGAGNPPFRAQAAGPGPPTSARLAGDGLPSLLSGGGPLRSGNHPLLGARDDGGREPRR